MRRGCFDLRIWLPALVAAVGFSLRALPDESASASVRTRSVSLPQLYGVPRKARLRRLELVVQQSSVRLLRHGRVIAGELVEGELRLGPGLGDGVMTLRLRFEGEEISYRGELVRAMPDDLPAVEQLRWRGTLLVDGQESVQSLQSWLCSLPGRRLRLQSRTVFAIDDDATMGLDLCWRPVR